jgi:preprotein translocase subunit Sec63
MAGFIATAKAQQAQAGPRPGAPPPPKPDEAEERKRFLRVLGLKDPADWDEVHAAFRRLAAKWHPDKHQEPAKKAAADKKFKEINAAYQWLGQRLRKAA